MTPLTHAPMPRRIKRLEHGSLVKIAIPSDPELLCVVRSTMTSLAEVLGLAPSDCRSVTIAVDEAITNIIRHAYRSQRDRPINVICRRVQARSNGDGKRRAGLEITLVDYGPAVDPTQLSARSLDEIKPGGLGLHFIRESMDVVSYMRADNANRLRLVKLLP
jgi:serine/threonine-protein kinase RsbW